MRHARWYIASVVSGIIVSGMLMTSGLVRGSKSAIVVEWGMYPEELEGCEVEIDGDIAGTLRCFGQASRTGFEVTDGSHEVAILHPAFDCEPREVTTGGSQRQVILVVDVGNWTQPDGTSETYFFFQ